jgi:hypothetical protein
MHSEKMEQPQEQDSETVNKLQKHNDNSLNQDEHNNPYFRNLIHQILQLDILVKPHFAIDAAELVIMEETTISRDILCRKCGRTGHFTKMGKTKQLKKFNKIM